MAVHKESRSLRRAQPLAVDDRVSIGREDADSDGSGLAQPRRDPFGGTRHVLPVLRVGAHARDARELDELSKDFVVVSREVLERGHPASEALRRSSVS